MMNSLGIVDFCFYRIYPDYSFNVITSNIMCEVKYFELGVWKTDPLLSLDYQSLKEANTATLRDSVAYQNYLAHFGLQEEFCRQRNYFLHKDTLEFSFQPGKRYLDTENERCYIDTLFEFFYHNIDFDYRNRILMPDGFTTQYQPLFNNMIIGKHQHYEHLAAILMEQFNLSISLAQYHVLYLLANKLSIKMIAVTLKKSIRTIEGHIERLKQKFFPRTTIQIQNFSAVLCQQAYLRLAHSSTIH